MADAVTTGSSGARAPTRGRRVAAIVGPVALALAAWLFTHAGVPWRLWSADERQYAVLARSLAEGHGFTTQVIYPIELAWGTGPDKPLLIGAPVWPLAIAATFAATGPAEWALHAASLAFFLALVAVVSALGLVLGGPVLGALSGVAAATSSQNLLYGVMGGTESVFAFGIGLVFLLLAARKGPVWVGLACGFAYLTRQNGIVLLPVALAWIAHRERAIAPLVRCGLAFGVAILPWLVRNWIVTGEPFFSLYEVLLHHSPDALHETANPLRMLRLDPGSPIAMDPAEKVRRLLPELLLHPPLASANLVACLGVLIGCAHRERACVAYTAVWLATTAVVALTVPNGRYFVPFVPVLLALGLFAWTRYGGRLRLPAMALLLATPLLPAFPSDYPDVDFARAALANARSGDEAKAGRAPTASDADLRRCLVDGTLVIAEDAPRVAWIARVPAVYLPWSARDFFEVVDTQPVRWAQIAGRYRATRSARFAANFTPRPDCGPDLYERTSPLPPAP